MAPSPDPERNIRRAVYAAVALLAVFAFTVSYSHIYDLGLAHAQHGIAAGGTPLSVDLLIVAATLVLYMQKRETARPRGLARFLPRLMLWAGIGATVAANVAYGWPSGWLSAACSAWPGAVFAGVTEMVLVTARAGSKEIPETYVSLAVPAGRAQIPANSREAAETAWAASVAGGNPLSETALATRFSIPRSQARKIRAPSGVPAAAAPLPPPPAAAAAGALNGDGGRR